jgi:hypothetical protein
MFSEEMKKLMAFIIENQAQTAVKLDALSITQSRSEKRWKETEKRIRALLARAKIQERSIATQKRSILASGKAATDRRLKTATDRRLKALADLVERQISERKGKR